MALPRPKVPICERPSVQTDGERKPALRSTFVGACVCWLSLMNDQLMTPEMASNPQKRNAPRQPNLAYKRGVTNKPSPEPICTEPPYRPCASDECLPMLAATPAPATNAPPAPKPTMA